MPGMIGLTYISLSATVTSVLPSTRASKCELWKQCARRKFERPAQRRATPLRAQLDIEPSQSQHDNLSIEARTMAWVQVIVVGLGLCPFARGALDRKRVRIVVHRSKSETEMRKYVDKEIEYLCASPRAELETTLVVAPDFLLDDFRRFHAFGEQLEADIESDSELVDRVMIARFHPGHEWGDLDADDPVNFDKRAPYPIINLLRADQVDEYIAQGRTADILDNNVSTLQSLGTERLKELYRSLSSPE